MRPVQLPLFPLPLVLFPGAALPLHIFEPRYRRMLADCLAGDRRFGLVALEPGRSERSLGGAVGCVAVVEETEPLPDGRSNLSVRGAERFVLDRVVPAETPYLVGEVRWLEDEPEPEASLAPIADVVRERFLEAARAARTIADEPASPAVDALALPPDAATLSFAVAAAVEQPVERRIPLLASRSARERLEHLAELLAQALPALAQRAAAHEGAKSNGSGPHLVA